MADSKSHTRGRPTQFIQVAELHAFATFLRSRMSSKSLSDLQRTVLKALEEVDFVYRQLTEVEQALLKEAMKPYRAHLRLEQLYEVFLAEERPTEYQVTYMKYYKRYVTHPQDEENTKILNLLCTRYYHFIKQNLGLDDLKFYLESIEKEKQRKKKRAEDQMKYELGEAVLSLFKQSNGLHLTTEQMTDQMNTVFKLKDAVMISKLYRHICAYEKDDRQRLNIFFSVLERLDRWKHNEKKIILVEIERMLNK